MFLIERTSSDPSLSGLYVLLKTGSDAVELYDVLSTLWLCLLLANGMCCIHFSGYLITSLVPLISTPWKRKDIVTPKSSVGMLDHLIHGGEYENYGFTQNGSSFKQKA